MSFQYGSLDFTSGTSVTFPTAQMPVRLKPALGEIADEDCGKSNPLLGFVIAIPLGVTFWLGLAALISLIQAVCAI